MAPVPVVVGITTRELDDQVKKQSLRWLVGCLTNSCFVATPVLRAQGKRSGDGDFPVLSPAKHRAPALPEWAGRPVVYPSIVA